MSETEPSAVQSLPAGEMRLKDAVGLLAAFAQAVNPQLGQHMAQVAQLSRLVGAELKLDAAYIDQTEMAGMIHDIGILGLSKELQNKEVSQLTEDQHRLYCEHPVIGSIAIEGAEALSPAGEMILFHHEYMNGKGFPNSLSGDQIPLGSRILLAVSDYCHILSSWPRDLRRLMNHARRQLGSKEWKKFAYSEDAESIIEESAERILLLNTEGKYDKNVVKALIRVVQRKKNIDPADMVDLEDLQAGMVLMDDLHLDGGRLLVTKGTKLLDATIQSLQGLGQRGLIPPEIYVAVPEAQKRQ